MSVCVKDTSSKWPRFVQLISQCKTWSLYHKYICIHIYFLLLFELPFGYAINASQFLSGIWFILFWLLCIFYASQIRPQGDANSRRRLIGTTQWLTPITTPTTIPILTPPPQIPNPTPKPQSTLQSIPSEAWQCRVFLVWESSMCIAIVVVYYYWTRTHSHNRTYRHVVCKARQYLFVYWPISGQLLVNSVSEFKVLKRNVKKIFNKVKGSNEVRERELIKHK